MANDNISDRTSESMVSISAPSMISESSAANKDTSKQSNSVVQGAQSTDQVVPEPLQTSPKPQTLTLALPSAEEGGKDHYAVIPFPKTYEDATDAAIKVLGCYMTDARPENVILRCSIKNWKGEWVWADIPPRDWTLVLRHNGAGVGVFEKQKRVAEKLFEHGKVYFTYGTRTQSQPQTTWTPIEQVKQRGLRPLIDKPKTYVEAVHTVKVELIRSCTFRTEENFRGKTFSFYIFLRDDLSSWIDVPSIAHTDDVMWRAYMPSTYGILGVCLS